MAEKLLKARKKVVKEGTRSVASVGGNAVIVVGNYKTGQLKWIEEHHVYNWPVREGDEFTPESFAKVDELWLYANAKSERHVFTAQFVRKMIKTEFGVVYAGFSLQAA